MGCRSTSTSPHVNGVCNSFVPLFNLGLSSSFLLCVTSEACAETICDFALSQSVEETLHYDFFQGRLRQGDVSRPSSKQQGLLVHFPQSKIFSVDVHPLERQQL